MNILMIIGAGVVAFIIGAPWYTILFGKTWMKEVGLTEEQIEKSGGGTIPMVLTLFIEILVAFLAFFLISKLELPVFNAGLLIAAVTVASSLKNYLFERKSVKLILINEGYKIVCILIMTTFYYFFGLR
ncbi:DUF1761 domain-containing protein [Lactococcus garvieae]